MRRHRLKENFGAKIRVIRDAIWRNLRAFRVSVFGFRQKALLISVALIVKNHIITCNGENLWGRLCF
jgi:hypothetical protein